MRCVCWRRWCAAAATTDLPPSPVMLEPTQGVTRRGFLRGCATVALQPAQVDWHVHQVLTNRLEMRAAALELLGDGVDVAEASLDREAVEDRSAAGLMVDFVYHLACPVDRERGCLADGDSLVQVQLAALAHTRLGI